LLHGVSIAKSLPAVQRLVVLCDFTDVGR
jgi:hypothetical protein